MNVFTSLSMTSVAAASCAAMLCASAGAATLKDELSELLNTHPRLKAEKEAVAAAKSQIRSARSGFLPKLNLSGDFGREVIDTPSQSGTSAEYRNKQTLSLTQNVFDGFQTWQSHSAAESRAEVAGYRLASVRQALLLEGVTAYYDMLRQSRMVIISFNNERAIRRQLNLEDERVQRGAGIAVDVLLAKTRLQLARERTVQLEGALEEARARYIQVFGREPIVAEMRDPDLNLVSLPAKLEEAEKVTREENPGLRASSGQVEVADRTRRALAGGLFPRVDLVGQVNREEDVDALAGTRRDWSILLTVSWELFSGFRQQADIATAAREKARAMNTHRFNERKVTEELRISWRQLETARERVALLNNAVAIAEEVFGARKKLRDAGKDTAINVLDAQSEVFAAQMNQIAAKFDAEVAAYRVLFSMGALTPEVFGL